MLKILEPIWLDKNETASRLRGRIEKILDWARVRGLREGDNAARWKGHLDQSFSPRASVSDLAAGRSGEILGARWQEFDLDTALWTVPAGRMKMKREHRVPLSSAAMDILKAMKQGERVFKAEKGAERLSRSQNE